VAPVHQQKLGGKVYQIVVLLTQVLPKI